MAVIAAHSSALTSPGSCLRAGLVAVPPAGRELANERPMTLKGAGMYAIFSVLNVRPEHVRAFREATIREARGTVRDEPGVFQFHILTDAATPTRFYYFEIYRDEAAAKAHWETENFKTYSAAVAGMLDGEVQRISTMRPVFPSDHGLEQQKAGLLDW
jgi:(4S)-4-hydroxy-5-phosphonooxypentane-2,3-dione isomerase